MDIKGRLNGITRTLDGGYLITFEVSALPHDISRLQEKDLRIQATQYREKRSLDANAYWHLLLGKIADITGESRPKVKNIMIARYGQYEMIDDKPVAYTTTAPYEFMMNMENLHTSLIRTEIIKGKEFYVYLLFRGSHTYGTKEMSILIDGTVQEAKELGIETLTPSELERLKQEWNNGKQPKDLKTIA